MKPTLYYVSGRWRIAGRVVKGKTKTTNSFTQEIARHEKNCTAENSIGHKLLTCLKKLLLETGLILFQVVVMSCAIRSDNICCQRNVKDSTPHCKCRIAPTSKYFQECKCQNVNALPHFSDVLRTNITTPISQASFSSHQELSFPNSLPQAWLRQIVLWFSTRSRRCRDRCQRESLEPCHFQKNLQIPRS